MTTLVHRRLSAIGLNRLIDEAPEALAMMTDEHRRSLAARFRAVSSPERRRLDAWIVERAGREGGPFVWTPGSARRTLGNAALRRLRDGGGPTACGAVNDVIDEQTVRALSGHARAGSLAHWVSGLTAPVRGLVVAEALNWLHNLYELAAVIQRPWSVAPSDAYYDVASARTSLRARRDLVVERDAGSVLLRVRAGAPGPHAGPGLRADLVIATLSDHEGRAPARLLGVWPDAGVVLGVDGTLEDLRAGARDLVRAAIVHQRRHAALAA